MPGPWEDRTSLLCAYHPHHRDVSRDRLLISSGEYASWRYCLQKRDAFVACMHAFVHCMMVGPCPVFFSICRLHLRTLGRNRRVLLACGKFSSASPVRLILVESSSDRHSHKDNLLRLAADPAQFRSGSLGEGTRKAQPPTGARPGPSHRGQGARVGGAGPWTRTRDQRPSTGRGRQAAGTVITRKAVRSDWRLGAVSRDQSYSLVKFQKMELKLSCLTGPAASQSFALVGDST